MGKDEPEHINTKEISTAYTKISVNTLEPAHLLSQPAAGSIL